MALVSPSPPCSSRPFPSAATRRRRFSPLVVSASLSPPSSSSARDAIAAETQRLSLAASVSEAFAEDQLWATACLRVRAFYKLDPSSYRAQEHKKYLAELEFNALKERVSGKKEGFRRISCINATVPLSEISGLSQDLCAACKYSNEGEDRVVVGSLDLHQGLRLPAEIIGKRPEGNEANYARAYLGNVCVASELHRNGLAYAIVSKSKLVAAEWGVSDLYVHVAADNLPAKNLYLKSGFVFESEEPSWQARFADRPRRLLLWTGLPGLQL